VFGVLFQLLYGVSQRHGWFYTPLQYNNQKCKVIPELHACEDMYFHQSSGLIYAACSVVDNRLFWFPPAEALNINNKTALEESDHVMLYNIETGEAQRLELKGLQSVLKTHGMDVYISPSDPSLLYVFLVNHIPKGKESDSVIEIFKTTLGSGVLTHVETVRDPLITTPNGIVALSEKSFYTTNDHLIRAGIKRFLEDFFLLYESNIVFRDEQGKLHVAISDLSNPNGLEKGPDDLFFLNSPVSATTKILKRHQNNSLTVVEVISAPLMPDNGYFEPSTGHFYVTGHTKAFKLLGVAHGLLSTAPSVVYRLKNTNQRTGESNYIWEKVFEDDGNIISTSTIGVYLPSTKELLISGCYSKDSVRCTIE